MIHAPRGEGNENKKYQLVNFTIFVAKQVSGANVIKLFTAVSYNFS
jgi:hypothetical protein